MVQTTNIKQLTPNNLEGPDYIAEGTTTVPSQ